MGCYFVIVVTYVILASFSQTAHSNSAVDSAKATNSTMPAKGGTADGFQSVAETICTSSFIPDSSICGAIISTGRRRIQISQSQRTNRSSRKLEKANSSHPEMAAASTHFRGDLEILPFPCTTWPEVLTGPCPSYHTRKLHKGINVGLSHSHYQVWMDFIFFDHDVLEAVNRHEVKGFYNSTSWSSTGGTFSASEPGGLHKNSLPFTEDDIIVIIEDDAVVAFSNISDIMRNEFTNMTTDLLVLGWRDTRPAHNLLASSFAYALTRRGARIAVKYFDPCGHILDLQLSNMARQGRLSHRSLDYLSEDVTSDDHDKRGIFVQKNKSAKIA